MKGKKLNILITGASGFVGRNLAEYLANNHADKYSLFYPYHKDLDLTDAEKALNYVDDNKIEAVIHCAVVGGTRKTAYDIGKTDVALTNLKMFFSLVRSAGKIKRIIVMGTGSEYDPRHYQPRMKEEYFGTHVPNDPYSFSKYVISKHIENSDGIFNLRLFGVFGKYEDYSIKFISNAIIKNLFNLPIIINQNVFFDYLFIEDLVKIIEKFIANEPKHKFFNAVTGETIDLVTIANKINALSDFKSEIIVKNPGLNVEYSGDNSRLMEEMDFQFTPFDSAVKKLFDFYKSILHTIDKNAIEKDEYIKYCRINKQ